MRLKTFDLSSIILLRHDRAKGFDSILLVGNDRHGSLAAVLRLEVVCEENKRETSSLDEHEVNEPQEALIDKTSFFSAFTLRAQPIETLRVNYGITRSELPNSRGTSVEASEHVLVDDVFPGDQ